MGLFSNLIHLIVGDTGTDEPQIDDYYEREQMADSVYELVRRISRISTFDRSITSLQRVTIYELRDKSLEELQRLQNNLQERLTILERDRKRRNEEMRKLEEAKWTGQRPKHMSPEAFDRWQRDD